MSWSPSGPRSITALAAAAEGRDAGPGGGRAEAEPHGRPVGLAVWPGVCTSVGGLTRRSAPAASKPVALLRREGSRLGSSLFLPFSCMCLQPQGISEGLSSHVTPAWRAAGRQRALEAVPAPPEETPGSRPGVSPRESPGHFGSWPPRHIHVEIAVMGTGNAIGSFFFIASFLKKIAVKKEGKLERKP